MQSRCGYHSPYIFLFFPSITEGIVSYSMPQGDVFDKIDVIDESYDGIEENGYLKGKKQALNLNRLGNWHFSIPFEFNIISIIVFTVT